jgi:hypothetical protein
VITKVFRHTDGQRIAIEVDSGEGGIWWWNVITGEEGELFEVTRDSGWVQLK